MAIQTRETLTPREYELYNQRKEFFELQAQHDLAVKEKDLELMRLEAKWSSWIKIPLTIVKLPVLLLFGIAQIVAVARKYELPEAYWRFIK